MKQILLVLFVCVCMPVMAASLEVGKQPVNRTEYLIHLKIDPYPSDASGRDRRSPAFIPITASHDAEALYLSSRMSIEDATIVVKDEWDNIVYEAGTTFLSGEETALPLNIGEGRYTLEITYGSIRLSGDFEIN